MTSRARAASPRPAGALAAHAKLGAVSPANWLSLRRSFQNAADDSNLIPVRVFRNVLKFHGLKLSETEFYHLLNSNTNNTSSTTNVDYNAFVKHAMQQQQVGDNDN